MVKQRERASKRERERFIPVSEASRVTQAKVGEELQLDKAATEAAIKATLIG